MNDPTDRISQDEDADQHEMTAYDEETDDDEDDEDDEDTNHWVPECGECGEAYDFYADVYCVNPECSENVKTESPLRRFRSV